MIGSPVGARSVTEKRRADLIRIPGATIKQHLALPLQHRHVPVSDGPDDRVVDSRPCVAAEIAWQAQQSARS